VKPIPHRHHAAGKRKIRRRLDRPIIAPSPDPVLTARNIKEPFKNKFQVFTVCCQFRSSSVLGLMV
jgi:hypothetical protein